MASRWGYLFQNDDGTYWKMTYRNRAEWEEALAAAPISVYDALIAVMRNGVIRRTVSAGFFGVSGDPALLALLFSAAEERT